MRLSVQYQKNKNTLIGEREINLSMLAFIKHFVMAGAHYEPKIYKLLRMLGVYLTYIPYLNQYHFKHNKFSEPPISYSDPTMRGQFSNLAGRAIADFLSKKIDKSSFTVNYEAAMRIKGFPITGSRPDLLAFTSGQKQFAIEAKGLAVKTVSNNEMKKHKKQAASGNIPVDFSVACVSYNLYDKVQCKYYDPPEKEVEFDTELFQKLTKKYYSSIYFFIEESRSNEIINIGGEDFYIIDVYKILKRYDLGCHPCFYYLMREIALLLPKNISNYAKNGLEEPLKPFEYKEDENIYIDNDRIGLYIKK